MTVEQLHKDRQTNFHRISGHLLFLVLLIYSIVYAAERFTYSDSAWQFFQRMNYEEFYFPSGRYGVVITEIPLYLAVKLHLPFKVLVYVFSSSYILIYYFIWAICIYLLKNTKAGIAILLGTFMGVREGFLHPVTETHQCLIFSILLYAVLSYNFERTSLKFGCTIIVALLVLFSHPVGVFSAGFAVVLYLLEQRTLRSPVALVILAILIIIPLWRFLFPTDNYDASFYNQLKAPEISEGSSENGALNFITLHFSHFYWLPELAGLLTVTWLSVRKEWLKLGLLTIGVCSYVTIACITYRTGDSSILMERAFLPAFFMINLVLAGLMVEDQKINKFLPMTLLLFFALNGIHYINAGCLMYKKRVAYLDKLIQRGINQGSDKYFMAEQDVDRETILIPWALSTETLLYSTFKYGQSISITFENEICDPKSVRLSRDLCLPATDLNPHYFKFSNHEYQLLQ